MLETPHQFALDSLADSFETVAFMSPMPHEEPHEPPSNAVRMIMRYSGSGRGTVEMVASRDLGKAAALNMLGFDPDSPASYEDTLKELFNIIVGLMLRRWVSESHGQVETYLPELREFDALTEWADFIASPDTTMLYVEGHVLALRVRGSE